MKIWCLLHDQQAHVTPVEAAFEGMAQFCYDSAWDPAAMLLAKPDLVLCVNDYPVDVVRCLDAARAHHIPSLVLQDGIFEWRCQYENPLFGTGGGAPQHQPVIADKIACLGRQSARQIAAWNDDAKPEITGMPRLDFLFSRESQAPQKPGKTILVMTAKNPGFTEEQREVTLRSLIDVKAHLASRSDLKVLWRVSKGVAKELEVENQLHQISSLELVTVLNQADAVITTLSTAMIEGMIVGRPVAALDYHNVPRFVPTAWTISAPTHIASVVNEILEPAATKMAFQQDCLADCVECDAKSAQRVVELIKKMVQFSKEHPNEPLRLPARMLGENSRAIAARPPLSDLYKGQSVFQETNLEQLQVRLARAENENARLKSENDALKQRMKLGSLLQNGVRRLVGKK